MKKILVTKQSNGNGRLDSTHKQKIYGIRAFYKDGRVLTTSGDVWAIKPYSKDGVDFISVH